MVEKTYQTNFVQDCPEAEHHSQETTNATPNKNSGGYCGGGNWCDLIETDKGSVPNEFFEPNELTSGYNCRRQRMVRTRKLLPGYYTWTGAHQPGCAIFTGGDCDCEPCIIIVGYPDTSVCKRFEVSLNFSPDAKTLADEDNN